MTDMLREAALDDHRLPAPGKISVMPTKAMATQRDLALAYSPGVAEACLAIVAAAAILNALRHVGKDIASVKLPTTQTLAPHRTAAQPRALA